VLDLKRFVFVLFHDCATSKHHLLPLNCSKYVSTLCALVSAKNRILFLVCLFRTLRHLLYFAAFFFFLLGCPLSLVRSCLLRCVHSIISGSSRYVLEPVVRIGGGASGIWSNCFSTEVLLRCCFVFCRELF